MKMKKPSRKNFKISKVKLLKDGGLDCHFETEEVYGDETFTEKLHSESSKDVHPDLRDKLQELAIIVARVFHLTFFNTLVANDKFFANKAQVIIAEEMQNELVKKINVTGISWSGQYANEGIVITATLAADNNQRMALNTIRMKFSDTRYGFEEQMEQIAEEVKDEVYEFLFEGKRAQLSLFGQLEMDGKTAAAGKESLDLEQSEDE